MTIIPMALGVLLYKIKFKPAKRVPIPIQARSSFLKVSTVSAYGAVN